MGLLTALGLGATATAGVLDLAAADYTACALVDGSAGPEVLCWGELSGLRWEQGSVGPEGPTPVPGPAGLSQIATDGWRLVGVDGDGVLWKWSLKHAPEKLWEDVVEVELGGHSLCVSESDGGVACWWERWSDREPLGEPVWTDEGAVDIEVGVWLWCLRTRSGEARCQPQPLADEEVPTGIVARASDAVGLALGHDGGCLLRQGAEPACFGSPERPDWATEVAHQASTGWVDTRWGWCAVGDDGGTRCAFDSDGVAVEMELPGPGPEHLALGKDFACGAWDDSVRCWGEGSLLGLVGDPGWRGPVPVEGPEGVVSFDVGRYSSCALDNQGQDWCWGPGAGGRPHVVDTRPPTTRGRCRLVDGVAVATEQGGCGGLEGAAGIAVATDSQTTCIATPEGPVRCEGRDHWGSRGHGRVSSPEITEVVGLVPPIADLDGADGVFCALDAVGMACWGGFALAPYRLGIPDPIDLSVGGGGLTCAVTESDGVWCRNREPMGYLLDGYLGVGVLPARVSRLDDARELQLGVDHACFRDASGALSCLGRPSAWRLGDSGTFVSDPVEIPLGATSSSPGSLP